MHNGAHGTPEAFAGFHHHRTKRFTSELVKVGLFQWPLEGAGTNTLEGARTN